jgi:hypothetical protein
MTTEELRNISTALRIVSLMSVYWENVSPKQPERRKRDMQRLDALLLAEDCLRAALHTPDTETRDDVLQAAEDNEATHGIAASDLGKKKPPVLSRAKYGIKTSTQT